MTIFCQIDTALVEILKEEANGRTIVDCGAGEGLLHKMMPQGKVISLDIIDHGNPNVRLMDCRDFPFNKNHMPVFIRPCHSNFVEETLMVNYHTIKSALYVGLDKNVEKDLGIFYNLSFIVYNEWIGTEGEKIYRIPFVKELTKQ